MSENKKEILEEQTQVPEENKEETAEARTQLIDDEAVEASELKAEQETAEDAVEDTKAESAKLAETDTEQKPKGAMGSKKLIIIIIAVVVALALAATGIIIARKASKSPTKKVTLTLEDGSPAPDSPEQIKKAHGESAEVITGEAATEKATIKSGEAIELITALSDEQLGLKKDDYTFMVAQQAYVIEKVEYVQVIAAEKKDNGDGTVSITPYGKYYISFDGATLLREDMSNPGNYITIKK